MAPKNSVRQKAIGDEKFSSIFWKLRSERSAERHKGCVELLNTLISHISSSKEASQHQPVEDASVGASEEVTWLEYSLERLLKGLAGIKTAAKLGFSTALILVLAKLHKRQIRSAFDTADRCLLNLKTETKQEASSKKSGICLLLLALCRSGALAKLKSEQRVELVQRVASMLGDTAIADLAACALASAVPLLTSEEFGSLFEQHLSARLSVGWDSLDINGLLLLLCCYQHHKDSVGRSFLKSHYGCKHLTDRGNFDHLLRICLSSADGHKDTLTQQAQHLHPATESLLSCLAATANSSRLSEFLSAAVAASLSEPGAPAGKKAVTIAAIGWAAAEVPEALPAGLSEPAAWRQLRLHAAGKAAPLRGLARWLLGNRLLAPGGLPDSVLASVSASLLSADCLFDAGLPAECQIGRTDVMARLPAHVLDDWASSIERTVSGGPLDTGRAVAGHRTLRLLACSRSGLLRCPGDAPGRSAGRALLCLAGGFLQQQQIPDGQDASAVAPPAAASARAAFCRALDSLAATATTSFRDSYRRCLRCLAEGLAHRLAGVESPAAEVARRCLARGLKLLPAGDGELVEAASDAKAPMSWIFALAHLHLGFHLLSSEDANDAEVADAAAAADDLDECHRRSRRQGRRESASAAAGEEAADPQQPRWPDVLLDSCLLGPMAGARSRLLRHLASNVARQLAPLVSARGAGALVGALLEGDPQEAGDQDGSGDDEEAGDDEANGDEDGQDAALESEEPLGDESDSSDDAAMVDPEFRRACKSALGDAACPSDSEADADPSDLSDSAMARVDEALALAFRANFGANAPGRRSRKAAALARRRRLCQAKMRALELAGALLEGGAGAACRAALAAGLARLALLAEAAGGGGATGGFWAAAPANERRQLVQRALALLKRLAPSTATATATDSFEPADAADVEVLAAARAALEANQRTPLPVSLARTAAESLSGLLRARPQPLDPLLLADLSEQLSARPRPRLGGLTLWRSVCSLRPGLLRPLLSGGRLLDLLRPASDGLKAFDRAAVAGLIACLVEADKDLDRELLSQLAESVMQLLAAEVASVTSARLLECLLNLAAALLKRLRRLHPGASSPWIPADAAAGLVAQLRDLLAGTRNRDLRRQLRRCLAAMATIAGVGEAAEEEEAAGMEEVPGGANKRRREQQQGRKASKKQKFQQQQEAMEVE